MLSRPGAGLFWMGLGLAFWPYALAAVIAAYELANGDDYCRAWSDLTNLAMVPAATVFAASAILGFDRVRVLVMLAVALAAPGLSVACGGGHG